MSVESRSNRVETNNLNAPVPSVLFWAFKEHAARSRMSQAEYLTRLLCGQFGMDVAAFGLDPSVEVAVAAAAPRR